MTGQGKTILKVAGAFGAVAAAFVAYSVAEDYVRTHRGTDPVPLVFDDLPVWVEPTLKAQVSMAAGGVTVPLTEQTAALVAENLKAVAWIDRPAILVTHNAVHVQGRWRRPLAVVQTDLARFYVDGDLVVLDFVPITSLPLVVIEGVRVGGYPQAGQALDQADLKAAVDLLGLLDRMDRQWVPQRPLLGQIYSLDVDNFQGRVKAHSAHLVLVAKDGTQVLWGAEVGQWGKYLEAKDDEKIAKLYAYYKESGYMLGQVKYVDLSRPQGQAPLPEDKYRQTPR